ncbi:hypothetical protein DCCM_4066 [Desulfocucumis palustris]|uniref:Uncharacterized protein n=1 Tax=Desulfocucumis palustris TaxID=1898651 RepID=A0A2L2XKX8_9FIRM|nr:hypothetical protein [Desulfocucumis palustris]GBF34946.1 hypothetical protein DCCM_4066 [Desulfocucumis palustris]
MGALEAIKDRIIWDINLKQEFKDERTVGYSFVIDVCDGNPQLALYRMKKRLSDSTILKEQPPKEILDKALEEQGITKPRDNIYNITTDVRKWIEDNLL